jgi:hypothetical protein
MYPPGAFAEFSSKWRTRSSHLRGGSENSTVVLEFLSRRRPRYRKGPARCIPRHADGNLMYGSVHAVRHPTTAEVGSGPDTLASIGCGLQSSLRCTHSETYVAWALCRNIATPYSETYFRDATTWQILYPGVVDLRHLECGLFRDAAIAFRPDRRHVIASAIAMCPSKPSDSAVARYRSTYCR